MFAAQWTNQILKSKLFLFVNVLEILIRMSIVRFRLITYDNEE